MSSPTQLGDVGPRRLGEHSFTPVPTEVNDDSLCVILEDENGLGSFETARKGPHYLPPLAAYIEYRAESAPLAWFAFIDGRLVARSATASEAQAALSKPSRAIGE